MSLIKCPTCSQEISYNYDFCPHCGKKVYDFEHSSDRDYEDDYIDYVTTTKRTKWYYGVIMFIGFLMVAFGVYWGIGDVISAKEISAAPNESLILMVSGAGLLIFTKLLVHADKSKEDFN